MCRSHYYFYNIPTASTHVVVSPKQDLIGT